MSGLNEQIIEVAGRRTRILRGGKANAPAALFVHGGIPGRTVFCSGAHIWGDSLLPFLDDRQVIALDMPGSGGTALGSEPLSIDVLGKHVLAVADALSLKSFDYVGQDSGGLVGLWAAMEAPNRVSALSVVASPMSPPAGDSLDNLLLVNPPGPPWGREAQDWALDRLSYSHFHIDNRLLDACVAAGQGEPHKQAVASMREHFDKVYAPSIGKTKYRLWELCRNEGLAVPTQIVWASHDPATSREAGYVLFQVIAKMQTATQFHVINRAGSLPFREQPAAFHHIVGAFQCGVAQEVAA